VKPWDDLQLLRAIHDLEQSDMDPSACVVMK